MHQRQRQPHRMEGSFQRQMMRNRKDKDCQLGQALVEGNGHSNFTVADKNGAITSIRQQRDDWAYHNWLVSGPLIDIKITLAT